MTWRWRDVPLRYKGVIVLALPLLALLLTAEAFYAAQTGVAEAERLQSLSLRIREELSSTQVLLNDAEGAARAYVVSRLPESLAGYRTANEALTSRVTTLAVLLNSDREQLDRLARLPKVSQGRPLTSLIDYANHSPAGAPVPDALLNKSHTTMNALRALVREMQTAEDARLAARTEAVRAAHFRALVTTALGLLLGFAMTVLASALFARGIARRIGEVAANARRLARDEPLSPIPPARDEVGNLADALAGAARLLGERDVEIRRRLEETAIANQELEAFSYSVSHDLRAPIRHVAGFASLLERSNLDRLDDSGRRYVKTIREAAARMGELVDDLLQFSRMGRTELLTIDVDLDVLVHEIARELQPTALGRDIVWNIGPLPVVRGDRAMLRVVFVNLLSNAVKYTSTRARPVIEVGLGAAEMNQCTAFVRDNGVGFDMAYADKLFGVFQRLHSAESFEGTGIGLASVRRIVQRHGGRVWGEGQVDAGATFYVTLPLAAAAERVAATHPAREPAA